MKIHKNILPALFMLGAGIFLTACNDDDVESMKWRAGTNLHILGEGGLTAGSLGNAYYVDGFTVKENYAWTLNDAPLTPERGGEFVYLDFLNSGDYNLEVSNGRYQGSLAVEVAPVALAVVDTVRLFSSVADTTTSFDLVNYFANPDSAAAQKSILVTGTGVNLGLAAGAGNATQLVRYTGTQTFAQLSDYETARNYFTQNTATAVSAVPRVVPGEIYIAKVGGGATDETLVYEYVVIQVLSVVDQPTNLDYVTFRYSHAE